MGTIRRAVIDVGTNSVKLFVGDVSGRDVRPVGETSLQTRLGKGFYETHRLQPESIARTARAVATFSRRAREHRAVSIRVIATSAARDAVNGGELTEAIAKASGLRVEIISGDQEAEWAFQGVTTNVALAAAPLLLLDVGGGSTEFILGQGDRQHFARSFPLGTVRLLEKFPHSDPPRQEEYRACRAWLKRFLRTEVRPALEPALQRQSRRHPRSSPIQLVGTGGTTSLLARIELKLKRFDRLRIEDARLSRRQVTAHRKHLWSLPLAGRRSIIGLPAQRADVILTGSLIFETVMEEFEFQQLCVSTRGLRFAAVID